MVSDDEAEAARTEIARLTGKIEAQHWEIHRVMTSVSQCRTLKRQATTLIEAVQRYQELVESYTAFITEYNKVFEYLTQDED